MKGFSLIELLLAIGLVALMTGGAMVSFSTTSRRERVNGAAARVRQALLQAKDYAQSGRKECGPCGSVTGVCGRGDAPLQGWRVVLTTNAAPTLDSFTVEGLCGVNPYPTPGWTTFYTRTETLPNSVEMTTAPSLSSVLFRARGGGIYPLPVMTPGSTRTISFTWGTEIRTVVLDSSGEVQ